MDEWTLVSDPTEILSRTQNKVHSVFVFVCHFQDSIVGIKKKKNNKVAQKDQLIVSGWIRGQNFHWTNWTKLKKNVAFII